MRPRIDGRGEKRTLPKKYKNDFMKHLSLLMLLLFLGACQRLPQLQSIGDKEVAVFNKQPIYFDMALKEQPLEPDEKGIIYLDAGRVLLKKVTLPSFEKQVAATIRMRLVSAGDPWDKLGSVFVIPASSEIDMVVIQKGIKTLKEADVKGKYPGVVAEEGYVPALELLHFLTPFGVGYFSDKMEERRPVYVPTWEKEVVWEQDVSNLISHLEGDVWIGVFVDTWTKEGYKFDLDLLFDESAIPYHEAKKTWCLPLVNTLKYMACQGYYDGFAKQPLEVTFEIPEDIDNVRLEYITTGHGGHSTGDEFTQKENVISLNGKEIYRYTPWRDDCASFRRFNPHSGVWTEKTVWKGDTIQERIASSDYSRSNWCPGSHVAPLSIALGELKAGTHTITIAIPEAQLIEGDHINYWAVSAYLVAEKRQR